MENYDNKMTGIANLNQNNDDLIIFYFISDRRLWNKSSNLNFEYLDNNNESYIGESNFLS